MHVVTNKISLQVALNQHCFCAHAKTLAFLPSLPLLFTSLPLEWGKAWERGYRNTMYTQCPEHVYLTADGRVQVVVGDCEVVQGTRRGQGRQGNSRR